MMPWYLSLMSLPVLQIGIILLWNIFISCQMFLKCQNVPKLASAKWSEYFSPTASSNRRWSTAQRREMSWYMFNRDMYTGHLTLGDPGSNHQSATTSVLCLLCHSIHSALEAKPSLPLVRSTLFLLTPQCPAVGPGIHTETVALPTVWTD